ncbi:hypothetical protein Ahy_B05g077148 isoform A [Arachis hypogaea]|uniref:Protein FAR1-RELATED SEQUENCE n=1 Tax=Arachis hypogaea TaxID=3818 RepID=A0A444Z4F3_ARAHY|nr:hypothetical protein Ahy_B05g077148 isoform A [Arachis hypogaea]
MSVRRTIENNEEATARGHHELSFIEKYVRNYITREVRNISKLEDANEFEKYLLKMKEKNQKEKNHNLFFELELELIAFWAYARSRAAYEYFGDVISFDTTYNINSRGVKFSDLDVFQSFLKIVIYGFQFILITTSRSG